MDLQLREALESMVWQFACDGVKNGKPILWTGGLSALEDAFMALGWDDPHYLTEDEAMQSCCEIEGCAKRSTCGTKWGGAYLRLCSEHHDYCFAGLARPPIKQHAAERERKRQPDGTLPLEVWDESIR